MWWLLRGENHGVAAHKDVKASEALKDKNHLSQLAMMGDIATINDIHSAYIHGSVPTAIGESNDIMNLNFPDEVGAVHCCRRVVYGCCWVLVCVRVCWLVLKPPFAPS